MSEARERYYKIKDTKGGCITEEDVYIAELEQRVEELEDKNQLLTDLNESLSEQIAKLGDTVKIKIPQLEADKAELLKYIEFAGKCCNSHGAYEYGKTFQSILKKHGVSL